MPFLFSIGHSTRSLDAFVGLLRAHGVGKLADVRTAPGSRRHPRFARDALGAAMRDRGIAYGHFPALGGLRRPRADSSNTGWQNSGFRGFADYMETPAFAKALEDLLAFAGDERTSMMCAEALWWRCHRRLIADALTLRGIAVQHIVSEARATPHEITPFARIADGRLSYPGLV